MISLERISDFLPFDSKWTGYGSIRFADPDGEVFGPTTIVVGDDGETSIEMDVRQTRIPEEFGNFDALSLMVFLAGSNPKKSTRGAIFGVPPRERGFFELRMVVDGATFVAMRGFVSGGHFGEDVRIRITANDLTLARRVISRPTGYFQCGAISASMHVIQHSSTTQ